MFLTFVREENGSWNASYVARREVGRGAEFLAVCSSSVLKGCEVAMRVCLPCFRSLQTRMLLIAQAYKSVVEYRHRLVGLLAGWLALAYC